MFSISIRRTDANELASPVREMASERHRFGEGFVCDIAYDASRFRLQREFQHLTLVDATFHNDLVCRLDLRTMQGGLHKPLMLGLPLYYVFNESELIVSSSLRLLRRNGIMLKEDSSKLPEYFVYRYITPPATLLRGVNSIPIGGSVRFNCADGTVRVDDIVWTRIFERTTEPLPFSESVDIIAEELQTGIQNLEGHNGRVGCLLSGGVDSSMLFKLAKDHLALGESHSTGYPFEDPGHNGERSYAEAAAATLGSRHCYHTFSTKQFLHAVIDAISHAELPVVHLQSVLLELVCARGLYANEQIVLNGQGADAIFGTNMMFAYQLYSRLVHSAFAPLMGLIGRTRANRSFPYKQLHEWSKMNWGPDPTMPNHSISLLGVAGNKTWTKNYFKVDDEKILRNRLKALGHFDPGSALDAFSILDFLSDVDLTQVIWGQIAAAHGRRMLYSFNSENLIRAANNTPWEEKLAKPKRLEAAVAARFRALVGAQRNAPIEQPKRLGRAVARRLGVPDSILARPKLSFGVPAARWAGPGGAMEPILKLTQSVIDLEFIGQFQASDESTAMIYWGWINYAIWKRLIIDGENEEVLHAELEAH